MGKYFVVSDIHGNYNAFIEILKFRKPDETIVLLGDYVDRGKESGKVLQKVYELLISEYPCIILKGNHDDMFVTACRFPRAPHAYYHIETFNSIHRELYDKMYAGIYTFEQLPNYVKMLHLLPVYHETEDFIFVHAGFDDSLDDWRKTEYSDFFWLRKEFYNYPHKDKRMVIHGHTPIELRGYNEPTVYMNKLDVDAGHEWLFGVHLEDGKYIGYDKVQKGND